MDANVASYCILKEQKTNYVFRAVKWNKVTVFSRFKLVEKRIHGSMRFPQLRNQVELGWRLKDLNSAVVDWKIYFPGVIWLITITEYLFKNSIGI